MARDPGDDGHEQNAHHDGTLQVAQEPGWHGQPMRAQQLQNCTSAIKHRQSG